MQYSLGSLLIYALSDVLYVYSVNRLLNAILGDAPNKVTIFLLNIAYYFSLLFVFLSVNSDLLNLFVNTVFMLLIALLHKSNKLRKLLSCAILLPSITGVEVIISMIASLFTENPLSKGPNSGIMLTLVVISKMVLLLLANVLSPLLKNLNKNSDIIGTPKVYWISIILIPIANMFVIYGFYLQCLKEGPVNLPVCIAIVLVVGITLLVFIFYNQMLDSNEAKAKLALQDLQIENYIQAYQSFQNRANEAFEIKHNLKNTAISLLNDIKSENEEGLEAAKKKLQSIVGEHKNICQRKWCGIPIIDAILNTKSESAQNFGIQVDADIRIRSFQLDDNLICIILGNALDNAIEACSKVTQDRRKIKLIMSDQYSNLFITITNPYSGEITFQSDSSLPLSTKCDPSEHGYGLSSIQRLVKKKDGIFNINAKNNVFQLSIVLYQRTFQEA